MFTGKNKIKFEEWYIHDFKVHVVKIKLEVFYQLPFEMQLGVILAYYDSLGVDIDIHKTNDNKYSALIDNRMIHQTEQNKWKTRNEAYKQAFIKADEIINKTI